MQSVIMLPDAWCCPCDYSQKKPPKSVEQQLLHQWLAPHLKHASTMTHLLAPMAAGKSVAIIEEMREVVGVEERAAQKHQGTGKLSLNTLDAELIRICRAIHEASHTALLAASTILGG